MKFVLATLVAVLVLGTAGTAMAAPLADDPTQAVSATGGGQDLRSPDAAGGLEPAASSDLSSPLSVSADGGLGTAMIVLIAVGGVLAFGGAALTMRRVLYANRHTLAG